MAGQTFSLIRRLPCVSWGEGEMGRYKRFVMEMQIIAVNQQKEQTYEVT